jgi:hypothetical protein
MDLYEQFKGMFSVDLKSFDWKIGNHNQTFIDVDNKIIWTGSTDEFDELSWFVSFPNVLAVKNAFVLNNGQVELKEGIKALCEAVNYQWEYDIIDSYVIMKHKFDNRLTVMDLSKDDVKALPISMAHKIFAISKLANFSKIDVLQSNDVSSPTITIDGTILFPHTRKGDKTITKSSLVEASNQRVTCQMDMLYCDQGTEKVIADSYRYYFTLDGNKIISSVSKIPAPSWTENIKTEFDFSPHPDNKEAWEEIDGVVKYSSDKLFIDGSNQVFVNTSFGWLLVDRYWLEHSTNVSAELKYEYHMAVNFSEVE